MATKSASPSKVITPTAAAATAPGKKPRTLAGQTPPVPDAARKSTLALYEAALKLMQTGKYDKAHEAFTRMLDSAPPDFGASIRMYIAACVTQIDKGSTDFKTHEERYDYAISLLNHGHYDDAHQHFQAILLKDKTADYAFYGLALMASMTGETNKCIEHLTEAIRLNAKNRLQARLDSDFEGVSDDPTFTELLYPEA